MSAQLDRLEVEETGDRIVVRFSETLSLRDDNIPPIAAELFRVAGRLGQRKLSLDLGRVDFLTGAALGQLVRLHKKVRDDGGRLNLCNVSPAVYALFEITRLDTLMDVIRPSGHY
jgi:anti-anti-sigma factor